MNVTPKGHDSGLIWTFLIESTKFHYYKMDTTIKIHLLKNIIMVSTLVELRFFEQINGKSQDTEG